MLHARHPEVVYTDLEDGAVLLHLTTRFYYSLDVVGAAAWRLLEPPATVEELIGRLSAEFDGDSADMRADLVAFLEALAREQLIVPGESSGTSGQPSGTSAAPVLASPESTSACAGRKPFAPPELIKHDEPLHAVVMNPFDPQLPLAE